MSEPVPAVPAATILIARDGACGLEVFMVKRHYQIDFMAGALVFPGGKVHAGDRDPALSEHLDGIGPLSEDELALRTAAIREAFEESGILYARERGKDGFVGAAHLMQLDRYRNPLEKGEMTLAEILRTENLRLACDCLVPFAHWITPVNMPKRFDTHFFIAAAPEGHAGAHDGRESVDSVWINPDVAIADRKKWNLVFPTKLNLMKLAPYKSVAEAIEGARGNPPLTVTPWIEESPDGQRLRIREDAGYAQTSTLLRNAF